jgi:hypothetical protein
MQWRSKKSKNIWNISQITNYDKPKFDGKDRRVAIGQGIVLGRKENCWAQEIIMNFFIKLTYKSKLRQFRDTAYTMASVN